jgi:chemotaxis protein MotB
MNRTYGRATVERAGFWSDRGPAATVWLLVGTLCSVGCVSKTKHELALAEAEQLNRNVAALQQDLATSQSQREALDTKLQAVQADLENTNKSLQERNQELNEVNEAIARRNKQVQDLIDKIAIVEADLNQKQTALEDAVARVAAAEALAKRTHDLYDDLVADLSNELAANEIKIEELKDGIKLNLSEKILFPSGSAKLSTTGEDVIKRVSEHVRVSAFKLEVSGYTDNVPIKSNLTKVYPTNWELAAARATSVVKVLESANIDRSRLMAVSFGENHPVAPNDTVEGRALNRRIEVRLRE